MPSSCAVCGSTPKSFFKHVLISFQENSVETLLYLKGLFPFSIYLSRKLRNLSQPRHKSMPRRIPPFIGPYIAHIFHPTSWRAVFCVAQKCLIKMKLLSLMPSSWGISFGSLPKSHASSNSVGCDFLWFCFAFVFWLLTLFTCCTSHSHFTL